jgi:hypothetical protein
MPWNEDEEAEASKWKCILGDECMCRPDEMYCCVHSRRMKKDEERDSGE